MADGKEGQRDPVEASADRLDRDLYDVTDWERRTVIDGVAAVVARLLSVGIRSLLVVAAVGLLVGQLGVILYAMAVNPGLGVLTLLSVVPAFLLVGAIWWENPEMRTPLVPLAVTFLLAVCFASFAAAVNSALQPAFDPLPLGSVLFFFLVVGPIEETVKLLSVGVYAYGDDEAFSAVIDGAVYGAVAGLGFATIENALYITKDVIQAGGIQNVRAVQIAADAAVTRGFVGPGHVIYSSFAGYYLGLAKFNRDDWGTIVVKGLLIAVLIHATYNSIVTYAPFGALSAGLSGLGVFVGFILLYDGLFGYLLYRKLSRYRDAYGEAVAADERESASSGA